MKRPKTLFNDVERFVSYIAVYLQLPQHTIMAAARQVTMAAFSEQLVSCIAELRNKRDEINEQILREEEDRAKIEKELKILNERLSTLHASLNRKMHARSEYNKTIAESEAAYGKLYESTQTLTHVLQRETALLGKQGGLQSITRHPPWYKQLHAEGGEPVREVEVQSSLPLKAPSYPSREIIQSRASRVPPLLDLSNYGPKAKAVGETATEMKKKKRTGDGEPDGTKKKKGKNKKSPRMPATPRPHMA